MKVVLGFSPFDRLYAEKFLRAEELSDLCDAVIAEPFDVATMSEEEILSETFGRFDGAEVYVLLLGKSAAKELHIDAQIKTAMRAGLGIVVINLPFVEEESGVLAHSPEEANAIDAYKIWKPVPREREYIRAAHPYLPERIAENLLRDDVDLSIAGWDICSRPAAFMRLADIARRRTNHYDFSAPLPR